MYVFWRNKLKGLEFSENGFVSLVGAGPGNPDYLTVKGLRVLGKADVILYDALLEDSFCEFFPKSATKIFVGKRKGAHTKTQDQIHEYFKKYASEGKNIVRLKGGDPFLFGRGAEEVIFLRKNHIPYEIIPGISSIHAACALCEIPLTHRGVSKEVLILGGFKPEDLDSEYLRSFRGTIVLFMMSEVLSEFCKALIQFGKSENCPVALLENVSYSNQDSTFGTIGEFAKKNLRKKTSGPGLAIIGEVVNVLKHNSPKEFLDEIGKYV